MRWIVSLACLFSISASEGWTSGRPPHSFRIDEDSGNLRATLLPSQRVMHPQRRPRPSVIPLVIRSNGQIPTTPWFASCLNHCATSPGPVGCPDGYFVCCVAKVTNAFMNTCHQANTQVRPTQGQHGPVVVRHQEPPIQHTPCSPALASTVFPTLPQLSWILVLTLLSSVCS